MQKPSNLCKHEKRKINGDDDNDKFPIMINIACYVVVVPPVSPDLPASPIPPVAPSPPPVQLALPQKEPGMRDILF